MMEAGTTLSFPFPTLKQLSLVSIGQSAAFPTDSKVCKLYEYSEMSSKFHRIVEKFPLPTRFKHELFTVAMGMYDQFWYWLEYRSEPNLTICEEFEPIFNYNGILDESRTWQRYFERMMSKRHVSSEDLKKLLQVACCRALLPQIDMMLRKILISETAGATELLGPRMELINGLFTLSYTFGISRFCTNVPSRHSAFDVLRYLNDVWFRDNWGVLSIAVTERDIEIEYWISEMATVNIDSLKRYLPHRHGPGWFINAMLDTWIDCEYTEFIQLSLNSLNHEDRLTFLSEEYAGNILLNFLQWPFTSFFIPLVTFVRPNLDLSDYGCLLYNVVESLPDNTEFDPFGLGDLLLEFWKNVPRDIKQSFRETRSQDEILDVIEWYFPAMNNLLKKNPILFSSIWDM